MGLFSTIVEDLLFYSEQLSPTTDVVLIIIIIMYNPRTLTPIHVERHHRTGSCDSVFGCLNIQSIANKLNDLLENKDNI